MSYGELLGGEPPLPHPPGTRQPPGVMLKSSEVLLPRLSTSEDAEARGQAPDIMDGAREANGGCVPGGPDMATVEISPP